MVLVGIGRIKIDVTITPLHLYVYTTAEWQGNGLVRRGGHHFDHHGAVGKVHDRQDLITRGRINRRGIVWVILKSPGEVLVKLVGCRGDRTAIGACNLHIAVQLQTGCTYRSIQEHGCAVLDL